MFVRVLLPILALACMGNQCASDVECGFGNTEVDGLCVPSSVSNYCDEGTVFDSGLSQCVSVVAPTECGASTMADDSTSVIQCQCAFDDCAQPRQCPAAPGGGLSLCGRIEDLATNAPIRAAQTFGLVCDPESPSAAGPCSLLLNAFDALSFLTDAANATPLDIDLSVDDCGCFSATTESPVTGFVVLALRDASAGGLWSTSALGVLDATAGQQFDGLTVWAVRDATVAAWTNDAGAPFGGQTFADVGAVVLRYMHGTSPVGGVTATQGGLVATAHYFSDVDDQLTTVDPAQTSTSANGAALITDTPAGMHSGVGAEVPGCEWPTKLVGSVPGVVLVMEFFVQSVTTSNRCL